MITLLDGNGNGGEEEGLGMKRDDKFVAVDWMKFAIFLNGCCSPWRWRPRRPVAGGIFLGWVQTNKTTISMIYKGCFP